MIAFVGCHEVKAFFLFIIHRTHSPYGQITSNRSLDGVLDTLNSRNMTDAGPLQLIDHEDKVRYGQHRNSEFGYNQSLIMHRTPL